MTISTTVLNADFAVMVADWGTSVTVQGNTACTGIVQELSVNDNLLLGGYDDAATVEILVKASDVTTLTPVPGNTVAVGSATYRIITVQSVTGDTILRLQCAELTA